MTEILGLTFLVTLFVGAIIVERRAEAKRARAAAFERVTSGDWARFSESIDVLARVIGEQLTPVFQRTAASIAELGVQFRKVADEWWTSLPWWRRLLIRARHPRIYRNGWAK